MVATIILYLVFGGLDDRVVYISSQLGSLDKETPYGHINYASQQRHTHIANSTEMIKLSESKEIRKKWDPAGD